MKTPSLKKVKERYKNVAIVKDAYQKSEFNLNNFDFESLHYGEHAGIDKDVYIVHGVNKNNIISLFDKQKGYAEIVTYKKPIRTNKLTELEKCVEALESKNDQKSVINMPLKPLKFFPNSIHQSKIDESDFKIFGDESKKIVQGLKPEDFIINGIPFPEWSKQNGLTFNISSSVDINPLKNPLEGITASEAGKRLAEFSKSIPFFHESFNFEGVLKNGKNTVVSKDMYDDLKNHLHSYRKENNELKMRIEELEAEKKIILQGSPDNRNILDIDLPLAGTEIKLEVGKYYIVENIQEGSLGFSGFGTYTEEKNDAGLLSCNIGFNFKNLSGAIWRTNGDIRLATNKEIKDALTKESDKRGFLKGVLVEAMNNRFGAIDLEFATTYKEYANEFWRGGFCLMKNGVWATIPKTITKSEAEKELGKKIVN